MNCELFFYPPASCQSQYPVFVRTVLFKVNVRNRNRETPLLLAVQADSVEAVAALLAFGARLDDPDVNGETMLICSRSCVQRDPL